MISPNPSVGRVEVPTKQSGGRHSKGMEGIWLLSGSGSRIVVGRLGLSICPSVPGFKFLQCMHHEIHSIVRDTSPKETQEHILYPSAHTLLQLLAHPFPGAAGMMQVFSSQSETNLQWSQKGALGVHRDWRELGGAKEGKMGTCRFVLLVYLTNYHPEHFFLCTH